MKYLTPDQTYWVFDVETDGLNPTQIWCVVLRNIETDQEICIRDKNEFKRYQHSFPSVVYIGHNSCSFDIPVLNRLWDAGISFDRVIDTLILGQLYYPNIPQGHSLEAWGTRFGIPKIANEVWSQWSPILLERCQVDVVLTKRLYLSLVQRMNDRGYSELSCWIEHNIREVIDRQERNGFWFNIPAAEKLLAHLNEAKAQHLGQISRILPPKLVPVATYKYRPKQDGTPNSHYLRHVEKYPDRLTWSEDKLEYTVSDYQDFNPGSPKQRLERLQEFGFQPTKKTKTGGWSVDEDSLLEFSDSSGIPEVKAIAEWMVLEGRSNQVENWLALVHRDDSRIHGSIRTIVSSRRMAHSKPNTANIPTVDVPYGKECRALWGVPEGSQGPLGTGGRLLCDYDAKALEARMLLEVLNEPKAEEFFLDGDPHVKNAIAVNYEGYGKPQAKKSFYAMIYGQQDFSLGKDFGKNQVFGKRIRQALYKNVPSLERAMKDAEDEYHSNSGFIRCPDGGFVRCDSPHAALNYRIQPAGAILMKLTGIRLDQKLTQEGIEHMKVADVHDEGIHECPDEKTAHRIGEIACETITECGQELGFRIQMDGSYKVGENWSLTH